MAMHVLFVACYVVLAIIWGWHLERNIVLNEDETTVPYLSIASQSFGIVSSQTPFIHAVYTLICFVRGPRMMITAGCFPSCFQM